MSLLIKLIGFALILLAVSDVFMTVLYARVGTGPISHRMASAGWAVVRRIARFFPRAKNTILASFGPAYLVLLMGVWMALLLLGFTLIAWTGLGSGIKSQAGETPTDFLTAFYYAGGSLTTAGAGDLRPVSGFYRCLTVLDSFLGISILTLAITYVIQIYTALQARNSLAMALHHASGGSGDAAVLLGNLGSGDDFEGALSNVTTVALEVSNVYESHHFYSVLTYFRFEEPHYAMARGTLVAMEMVTLAQTALDPQKHAWFGNCAATTHLREASMHVLMEFAGVYIPGGPPKTGGQPPEVLTQWKRRYFAALDYLRERGISVTPHPEKGVEEYVKVRCQWDPYVVAFARYMEHPLAEIDPTGVHPAETAHHREMPTPPMRAAG